MKSLFFLIAAGLLFFISCTGSKEAAQTPAFDVKQAVESNQWIFVARQSTPMGRRPIMTNGYYDIKLSNDSLVSQLPYFGRSTGISTPGSGNPMNFTATGVQVTKEAGKKSGWNISIKPINYREVTNLQFSIFENGTASLNVTLLNNSGISYSGFIKQVK
jgi:Domain of unknown function (DUF4251)